MTKQEYIEFLEDAVEDAHESVLEAIHEEDGHDVSYYEGRKSSLVEALNLARKLDDVK